MEVEGYRGLCLGIYKRVDPELSLGRLHVSVMLCLHVPVHTVFYGLLFYPITRESFQNT